MAFEMRDYDLSMKLSPRGRRGAPNGDELGLRTLLIHRLTNTAKLVIRRARTKGRATNAYCEPCDRWLDDVEPQEYWTCPACGRLYRLEMAIYEEVTLRE